MSEYDRAQLGHLARVCQDMVDFGNDTTRAAVLKEGEIFEAVPDRELYLRLRRVVEALHSRSPKARKMTPP